MSLGDQILNVEMDFVYCRDGIAKAEFGEPKPVPCSKLSKFAYMLLNAVWPTSLHYEMGRLRQMGALLNLAYQDIDSSIDSEELDRALDALVDKDYVTRRWIEMKQPSVRDARKELLRQKYLFFRQILKQEGVADSCEDALRRQFGTRENYLTALQPVIEANEALLAALDNVDSRTVNNNTKRYIEIYQGLWKAYANQVFATC